MGGYALIWLFSVVLQGSVLFAIGVFWALAEEGCGKTGRGGVVPGATQAYGHVTSCRFVSLVSSSYRFVDLLFAS